MAPLNLRSGHAAALAVLALPSLAVAGEGPELRRFAGGGHRPCPKCDYELPATYPIANGLRGPNQQASYRGEYFDVYSKPIRTRYGDVVNVFNYEKNASTMVPLPPEIVARFQGKVMAITGFETNIVEIDAHGIEKLVPCTAMYNHHWSHLLVGANASGLDFAVLKYYDYPGAGVAAHGVEGGALGTHGGDWVGPSHADVMSVLHMQARRASAGSAPTTSPRPSAPSAAPFGGALRWADDAVESAPTAQFFSEGNGNEHRLSFHGYGRGYAQLIKSPHSFFPGIMFINTKDTTGTSPNGHGTLVPKVALASGDVAYSALLECPCGTRLQFQG
mmetsp:Transcript_163367/g.523795  ORF Transcript_163367/g.523795 Transcript_163367/m.523795 type:complete len:332 (+) Transcript_163367:48-1043(+)